MEPVRSRDGPMVRCVVDGAGRGMSDTTRGGRREEEEGIFYCVSFVAHEHAWQGSKGSRRRRQVVREEKERGRERERERGRDGERGGVWKWAML